MRNLLAFLAALVIAFLGFGWYLGAYEGMPFADHEGAWTGFYSYIIRYMEHPLSIFVLVNRPNVDFAELANVATDAYG